MSLHAAAQHLADKGRGTDTTLVHMSPREVQGLQALAKSQGGSLTVNPHTGMVEAGFLEQALPIVAAAAATYFTAGAAAPALSAALGSTMAGGILAGAGAGALIGGGSAALQGKDAGQGALYGGIGGAISGGTGAYDSAGNIFSGATQTPPVEAAVTPTITNTPTASEIAQMRAPVTDEAYKQALAASPSGTAQAGLASPQQVADIQGFTQGIQQPPTPGSQFYAESNPLTKAGLLALPGMGAAAGSKTNMPGQEQYDPNNPMRWKLSNNFQGSEPVRPNPYYHANYSNYAAGGMVAMAPGGLAQLQGNMYPQSQQDTTQFATPSQMPTSAEVVDAGYDPKTDAYTGQMTFAGGGDVTKKKKQADLTPESNLAKMDPYNASVAGLNNIRHQAYLQNAPASQSAMNTLGGIPTAAQGGLSHLGGYSDGGRMLKGGGDGMSDSIPATIGNKQPARLADGEFVVPADVVSHLGNGSTDAGAKRLYAMMDKVRQARTGRKAQGKQINPNKFLP